MKTGITTIFYKNPTYLTLKRKNKQTFPLDVVHAEDAFKQLSLLLHHTENHQINTHSSQPVLCLHPE